MTTIGIMEEVRSLLTKGKSSGEVIALGFKPPTVYKVQRQLKRKSSGSVSALGNAAQPTITVDDDSQSQSEAENIKDSQEVENLNDRLESVLESSTELATEVQALIERVAALELEAQAIAQLSQRIKDLETQVDSICNVQKNQQQQFSRWKERAVALEPVITAVCTQLDCLDQQGMVVLHQPEHLQRRSEEALGIIRKLSQYKGEEAEQAAALVAMLWR